MLGWHCAALLAFLLGGPFLFLCSEYRAGIERVPVASSRRVGVQCAVHWIIRSFPERDLARFELELQSCNYCADESGLRWKLDPRPRQK